MQQLVSELDELVAAIVDVGSAKNPRRERHRVKIFCLQKNCTEREQRGGEKGDSLGDKELLKLSRLFCCCWREGSRRERLASEEIRHVDCCSCEFVEDV